MRSSSAVFQSRGIPLWRTRRTSPVLEVFEELTAPGKSVEDGKVVERLALAETMTIDIPKLGTMACLNADGLRTLLRTCAPEIPNMFEKNLRYPEYVDQNACFDDLGFFSETPIEVNGVSVRPIDVSLCDFHPGLEIRTRRVRSHRHETHNLR